MNFVDGLNDKTSTSYHASTKSVNISAKDIGVRIADLRGRMTQADFGKEVGVTSKTVGRWEAGESVPDGPSLLALLERFAIDPVWLLTGQQRRSADQLPSAMAGSGDQRSGHPVARQAGANYAFTDGPSALPQVIRKPLFDALLTIAEQCDEGHLGLLITVAEAFRKASVKRPE